MKRIFRLSAILFLGLSIPLISVSGQDKKNENKVKVIIVDDTGNRTVMDTTFTGDEGRVYVYNHASSDGKPKKHVMITSTGDGIISHEGSNSYIVTMSGDNEESGSDAPKYIIAKDGVVVTIQTDNEEKGKELQQLIENKLGVKKSGK